MDLAVIHGIHYFVDIKKDTSLKFLSNSIIFQAMTGLLASVRGTHVYDMLQGVGKHRMTKGCRYFGKLASPMPRAEVLAFLERIRSYLNRMCHAGIEPLEF